MQTASPQQERPPACWLYARQSEANERSIDQQVDAAKKRIGMMGWVLARVFKDTISASTFAAKARPHWPKLLKQVAEKSRPGDLIWIWEPSRAARDLEEWAAFLKFLKKHQIRLWIESHGHLYDVANSRRDWKSLAEDGIDSQWESEKNSARVTRDVSSAAELGRAHGRLPYGFRREYDWRIGSTGRKSLMMAGQFHEPAEAAIVKEIIESAARGESLRAICVKLNEEGKTNRAGKPWTSNAVRGIAVNPIYIGKRVHLPGRRAGGRQGIPPGARLYPAEWTPIVDADVFWAAHKVLTDQRRSTWRSGGVKHLLTGIAECGVCGTPLGIRYEKRLGGTPVYVCSNGSGKGNGCVSIWEADLDDLVMEVLKDVLAGEPDTWYPAGQAGGSADLDEAAGALKEAQDEYNLLVSSYNSRQITMRGYIEAEPAAAALVDQAKAKVDELAQVSPELDALKKAVREHPELGAARVLRDKLTLPTQRGVIRLLLRIRVDRAPSRGRRVPARDRVRIGPHDRGDNP